MANLTDSLPLVTNGRDTQAPVRPAPSIFESLARAGTQALDMVHDAGVVSSQRATARRQAATDARQAADRSAENDVARSYLDIVHPSPANTAAYNAAQGEAQGMAGLQAGVDQGRVTRDGLELRADMALRRLIAAHPGAEGAVLQAFRENGLESPLMREYNQAATALEEERKFNADLEHNALNYAQTHLGLMPTATDSAEARERIVQLGLTAMRTDAENARLQAEVTLNSARVNLDERQRSLAEDSNNRNLRTIFENRFGQAQASFEASITQLASDPVAQQNPQHMQERLSSLVATIEGTSGAALNQFIAQNPGMTPDTVTYMQNRRTQFVHDIREFVTGDNSVVAQRVRTMQLITATLGINAAQMFPVYMQVSRVLGNAAVADSLFTAVQGNQPLINRLRNEIASYNGDPSSQSGRQHITALAGLLAGNSTIRDFNPQQARRLLQDAVPTVQSLWRNPDAVSGRDVSAHAALVHAILAVTTEAQAANAQWGATPLRNIAATMVSDGTVAAVFNASANPEKRALAQASWFTAGQRIVNELRQTPTGDPYYNVQWRPAGRGFPGGYVIVRNQTPLAVVHSQGGTGFMRAEPSTLSTPDPGPSLNVRNQAAGLNMLVDGMARQSANGHDPAVQAAGISWQERRALYGTGRVPAALTQERSQQNHPNVQTWDQNVDALGAHTMDWLHDVQVTPNAPMPELESPGGGGSGNRPPFSQVAPRIRQTESGHNYDATVYNALPRAVSRMNIGELTDWQPQLTNATRAQNRARGLPSGSSGVGAYQFERATLIAMAQRVFGANWRNVPFSRENQDRLAEALYNEEGLRPWAIGGVENRARRGSA